MSYICLYAPGLLLLALLMSCKKQILEIKDDLSSEQQLMKSNTENPGTDCSVNTFIINHTYTHTHTQMLYIFILPDFLNVIIPTSAIVITEIM